MSLASQVLMRRRGLDPNKLHLLIKADRIRQNDKIVEDPTGCADWVANTITAFSCMIAENFLDLSKPTRVDLNVAPTADYWAVKADFAAMETAVWAALGKVLEERRAKLATVPPMEAAS
jgi:hypothetical protein